MVIDYLHIGRASWSPAKADAPLSIDANAVLAFASGPERLQLIVWRDAQIGKIRRRIEHPQLALNHVQQVLRETARDLAVINLACLLAGETLNHTKTLTRGVNNVKRWGLFLYSENTYAVMCVRGDLVAEVLEALSEAGGLL